MVKGDHIRVKRGAVHVARDDHKSYCGMVNAAWTTPVRWMDIYGERMPYHQVESVDLPVTCKRCGQLAYCGNDL